MLTNGSVNRMFFSLRFDCQKYEGKRKEKVGPMTHITVAHDELDGKSRLVIKFIKHS